MKRWTPIVMMALAACGPAEERTNPIDETQAKVAEVKDDVKTEVVDTLDCSGTITQETRTLVADALAAADFDPTELVTGPEELARFIGAVAVSTDTTAMLLGNVAQIARTGHVAAAHAGMWDTLACDDIVTSDCTDAVTGATTGSVTSTVACDAGSPSAVELEFSDDCTLFVTRNAGAVSYRREGGAYEFDGLRLGSVRQVDGVLAATLEAGDVQRLVVSEADGISIASNAGKSCEERLTIRELVATTSPDALSADIDAERLADGKTMSLAMPMGPATFTRAANCACPDPGSVVDWRWTGFLKGQGDANLRLAYREATRPEACADVEVEILSWPSQCEGESTDCGKAATEALLGPLLAATCVAR